LDIARYGVEIFNRAPADAFDRVELLAVMHIRAVICLGDLPKAQELTAYYEAKYLRLPEDDAFRNHTLGGIYYCWGILRSLMCTTDDRYDFDVYYAKLDECLSRSPINVGQLANHPAGPWISLVGSSRKGAPQEFNEAFARAVHHVSHCLNGAMAGGDHLACGELAFYQGDTGKAESLINSALVKARQQKQFELVHRALFYILRIAVFQGNYIKAELALKDMEALLLENEYSVRFVTYDITLAWYYFILGIYEKIPDWLKERFTSYGHVYFIENFGNQVKACYHYITKNYPPLLAYMEEQKRRESILFGRVEMLAMEACVHYKEKNKTMAYGFLAEAWEIASPNGIIMPFIELGKDMRTLCASAAKESKCKIPGAWLENINRKAATYAKRQTHVIAEYKQAHNMIDGIVLSPREKDILKDLSYGLSRAEIAAGRNISINTVKMVINNIYYKVGAENVADLVRITVERKMI